jgi:penicillin-binding protein 2
MFSSRVSIMRVAVFISSLFLLAALFYFQIISHGYYRALSLKNTVRTIPLKASRGAIYDRTGAVLAKDDISFNLVLIPQEISDLEKTFKMLSVVTGKTQEQLEAAYRKNYRLPFVPANVVSNISPEKAFRIEEKLVDIPGAFIWSAPKRLYPNGRAGSHVIGYVGNIADSEISRLKDYGYSIKDLVGKSGIERYYDIYLKGNDGGIQVEVDSRSREVSRIGFKEPVKGKDISLTIDIGLERFVDMLFEGKKGACIVMQSRTGRILSLVSSPEFDPNIFVTGKDSSRLKILRDIGRPLLNRAITGMYPPGSTFKTVVAYAGLATGTIKQDTSFLCEGIFKLGNASFRCWKASGHGYQDVVQALAHSCNIFFYNLGKALGAEQINRYALSFGLGSTTGIDLPQESKGTVPGPMWKRFILKTPWYEGDTINYSIGQGYLEVTPIQMLRVITIAANNGFCPQPYIVEDIEGVKISHNRAYFARLKPEFFRLPRAGLFNAVNEPTGTGQRARVKGLDISGKTGTAQAGTLRASHAWFTGYLPSDTPLISLVVFIEHGGKGGKDAADIARLISVYLNNNGFLEKD